MYVLWYMYVQTIYHFLSFLNNSFNITSTLSIIIIIPLPIRNRTEGITSINEAFNNYLKLDRLVNLCCSYEENNREGERSREKYRDNDNCVYYFQEE